MPSRLAVAAGRGFEDPCTNWTSTGDDEYKNYLIREVCRGRPSLLRRARRGGVRGVRRGGAVGRRRPVRLGDRNERARRVQRAGSAFDSAARVVDLAESTVGANATAHRRAATLGLGTIMASKQILLLAKANKKAIVETLARPALRGSAGVRAVAPPEREILIES